MILWTIAIINPKNPPNSSTLSSTTECNTPVPPSSFAQQNSPQDADQSNHLTSHTTTCKRKNRKSRILTTYQASRIRAASWTTGSSKDNTRRFCWRLLIGSRRKETRITLLDVRLFIISCSSPRKSTTKSCITTKPARSRPTRREGHNYALRFLLVRLKASI